MFQYHARRILDTVGPVSRKVRDLHTETEAPALALLDSRGTNLCFRRHEMIFREGDCVSHFYRLVKGTIQLSKLRRNGRRQIVRLLLPGNLLGFEIGDKRRLTAESLDETVVSQYPSEVVEQIGERQPDLYQAFMGFLRRQLSATQEHAVMLGRQTAVERVAAFFFLLSKRKNIGDGEMLSLPMRRRDLADYLGLSVETVSRVLTRLNDAGLIEVSRTHGQFIICDVGSLEDVMLDAKAYGMR